MLNAEKKQKTANGKKSRGFLVKISRFVICFCVALLVVVLGINAVVCFNAMPNMKQAKNLSADSADCIIVLGCGVNGYQPSPMLKDRLDMGITLYKSGAADKLLMSGDHGVEFYNEVGVMKAYAMEQGVPSEDIFMDHAGFSTYESLYRVKNVFGCKKVIAVTQEYHLYRTVYLGGCLDMDMVGVSTENYRYGGMLNRNIREIFARDKDFITSILKRVPKMPLGDGIDINGKGNVTNDDAFLHIAEIKGLEL